MTLTDWMCACVQEMKEVGDVIHALSKRIIVYDRKRKQDEAVRLQTLWQRWELSNFDYLMKVGLWPPSALPDLHWCGMHWLF